MKYNIIGTSRFGKEIIDTASNKKEAVYLVKEYQMAFGLSYNISYEKI